MGCCNGLNHRIVEGQVYGNEVGLYNAGKHTTASYDSGHVGHENLDQEDSISTD